MTTAMPNFGKVSFIPYVTPDESQRKRELWHAHARSHIGHIIQERNRQARKSGQKRARASPETEHSDRSSTANESTSSSSQTLSLRLSPVSSVTASDKSSPDADEQFFAWEPELELEQQQWQQDSPPQSSSSLVTIQNNRQMGWHFGSIGYSCRPLSDIDSAALQHFLAQIAVQQPATSLGNVLTGVTHRVLPVSREVARQAIHQRPLLESLIAYTTFGMQAKYPDADILKSSAQESTQKAVVALRKALTLAGNSKCFDLAYAVAYLAMGAIAQDQLEVAAVHLRYLREVLKSYQPKSDYEYCLWFQIRGNDTRYAVQAGKPLITSGLWTTSVAFPESLSEGLSYIAIRPDEVSPISGDEASESIPENSTGRHTQHGQLYPQGPTSSGDGFYNAIEQGMLSSGLRHIVGSYLHAIQFLSRLSEETKASRQDQLRARAYCYESLELLCTEWYNLQMRSTDADGLMTRLYDTSNRLVTIDTMWLDKIIIMAFELHLIMCLNTCNTLVVLGQRLRNVLEESEAIQLLVGTSVFTEEGQNIAATLCLWSLLMGMLGTVGRSRDFEWMQIQAGRLLLSLKLTTEDEVVEKLTQFSPSGFPLGDDLIDMIREVFGGRSPIWGLQLEYSKFVEMYGQRQNLLIP